MMVLRGREHEHVDHGAAGTIGMIDGLGSLRVIQAEQDGSRYPDSGRGILELLHPR